MASVWPWTSRVSRICGVTEIHLTLAGSILLARANAGNSSRLPSPSGDAKVLPTRSWGLEMFFDLSVTTAASRLSNTCSTLITAWVGFSALNLTRPLTSEKPMS